MKIAHFTAVVAALLTASSAVWAYDFGETVYRDYLPYSYPDDKAANPWFIPGNEFFSPSQYSQDCSNAAYPWAYSLVGWEGGASGHVEGVPACKIIDAPVVDMAWVNANLVANGYTYNIAYPMTNFGNDRAEIYWMKKCWAYIPAEIGNVQCYHGMARLVGAPWVNQFAPVTTTTWVTGEGPQPVTYPYGSTIGGYVATWPEPGRGVGFIYTRYGYDIEGPHVPSQDKTPRAALDDWLRGTEPPVLTPQVALPPIPPYVPAGDPSAINVGGVSSGGSAGLPVANAIGERNSLKFDFSAFCGAPGKDGRPRSPSWVAKCLAGQ